MTDLKLSDIGNYYGTEAYHRISPFFSEVATDGVAYIMNNGYGWLVTDALAWLKFNPQDFAVVKLKLVADGGAIMEITDGNDKVLYSQKYDYTDAESTPVFYVIDGVALLEGEY